MKKRRFEELHRKAIRWPDNKLEYVGIDGDQKQVIDKAKKGEVGRRAWAWTVAKLILLTRLIQLKNAYLPFQGDLYGCHSKLASKRIARNPFLRFHPYWASAKELRGLLEWCPDDRLQKPEPRSWWNVFGSGSRRGDGDRDSGWDLVYPGQLPWDN
jgi:hypothetical protein